MRGLSWLLWKAATFLYGLGKRSIARPGKRSVIETRLLSDRLCTLVIVRLPESTHGWSVMELLPSYLLVMGVLRESPLGH